MLNYISACDDIMPNHYVSLKMQQDFQLKHSESETATTESIRNLQSEIHGKEEEIDILQKEIVKHEDHVDSLGRQLSELQSSLQEKEQVALEFKEREKQLEDKKSEVFFSILYFIVIHIGN